MKNCFAIAVLLCLPFVCASAQSAPAWSAPSTPWWELSGGYQFDRAYSPCCENFGGFTASIQENKSRWFGGILDVGTSFHSVTGFSQRLLTVSAGPQFTYRRSSHIQPFVHAMLGGANLHTIRPGSTAFSESSVAAVGGAGLDFRINSRLYARGKADFVRTEFASQGQNYGQLSFGVVYRMGTLWNRAY